MSVSDGQKANATNFNNAFVSRTQDTNTVGKLDLNNTATESGTQVSNIQKELNSQASFSGTTVNQNKDNKPSWNSDAVGSPNQSVKDRVDSVQTQVETNSSNITANTNDIADIRTTTGTSDGDTDMGTYSGSTISDNGTTKANIQELETAVEARQLLSEKGVANGYAELDGTGRVPSAQLPVSAMEFKGNWNANTNTPTLADGVGTNGDYYNVSDAGSQDLGSGSISFDAGDSVIYDGSTWVKLDNIDSVTPTNSIALENKTIDGDLNTISNLAHGSEVDNPSSGVHGVVGNILGDSDTQVVTNKDIDGGTASNSRRITLPKDTTANLDLLTDKEGTLWYDTTLQKPVYNDGTDNIAIGTGDGSGGGGINYILNPDAETDTSDTSSSANVTITRDTVSPARGTASFQAAFVSAVSGNYAQLDLDTIDNADLSGSEALTISFDYSTTTGLANGDLQVVIRDNTASADIVVDDIFITSGLTEFSKFTGVFYLPSASTDFDLRIQATTSITSETIEIDNIVVSPQSLVPGAIYVDYGAITPTLNNDGGVVSVDQFDVRRAGNTMEIDCRLTFTGTGAVGTTFSIQNPIANTSFKAMNPGAYVIFDWNNNNVHKTSYMQTSSNVITFINPDSSGSVNSTQFQSGGYLRFTAKIEINEWSTGAMLSTSEAVFSTVAATLGCSTTQSIPNNTETFVAFEDPIGDIGDKFNLASGTGTNWKVTAYRKGRYRFAHHSRLQTATGWQEGEVYYSRLWVYDENDVVQTTRYFFYEETPITSSTSVHKTFQSTPVVVEMQKGWYAKVSFFQNSDAAINFPSGSISHFSVTEEPDFSTFSVYGANEFLQTQSSEFSFGASGYASGEWMQMVGNSVTLPANTSWILHGSIDVRPGDTTGIDDVRALWSESNGDNTTAFPGNATADAGRLQMQLNTSPAGTLSNWIVPTHTIRVTTTTQKTIYLVGRGNFSAVGASPGGLTTQIYAERLV